MLAKVLAILISAAAIAAALLVNRQQRIDTFHDISSAHQRMIDHQRDLWQLRCEVAHACRPAEVRIAMNQLDMQWAAIPAISGQDFHTSGARNRGVQLAGGVSPIDDEVTSQGSGR